MVTDTGLGPALLLSLMEQPVATIRRLIAAAISLVDGF